MNGHSGLMRKALSICRRYGRIRAAGMTHRQLKLELENRLREYIVQPQVFIQVTQFRGSPVFFEGLFSSAGDLHACKASERWWRC